MQTGLAGVGRVEETAKIPLTALHRNVYCASYTFSKYLLLG